MRLLLDTHVFLWWREDNARLGSAARDHIASAESVFVSVVSAWEVAIKVAAGKLRIDGSFESWVEESRFTRLSDHFRHAGALAQLPLHHRDPFDRMLIAQAEVERLVMVTADRRFEPYGVPVIWS
jgi:PIN domain nuclease of toxin-antitoxin system